MNLKEHVLEELELQEFQVREVLQCLLHTILFVRAPGPVQPREMHCTHLNMTYACCGVLDVEGTVDSAIEGFWNSLTPAGPDLSKGQLTLSFFERRVKKSLFGMMSNEEKVAWEQWVIPVLVNNAPRSTDDDQASVIAQQRMQQHAEAVLKSRMITVFNFANGPSEHIPPVMYEYEILCAHHGERRESFSRRMMQTTPAPLTL